jgi:cytochrome b561
MIDKQARYGKVAMGFHWLSALVVVTAFALGLEGSEARIYAPANLLDRQLHESLGVAVLVLTVLRVLWKWAAKSPVPVAMPRWMHRLSKALQGLLYLLLLVVPVLAFLGVWLMGYDVALLGGTLLAPALPVMEGLGDWMVEVHTLLADAILWLAGLHAAASLFHHYVLKDGVLVSMLPAGLAAKLPGLRTR